jgi:hypothetical protein
LFVGIGAGGTAASGAPAPRDGRIQLDPSVLAGVDTSARTPGVKSQEAVFIIRMKDDPAASYRGGIKGYPASAAPQGQKYDPDSPAARKYRARLEAQHDAALAAAGVARQNRLYSYTHSLNGFAAVMSPGQVAALRKRPDVMTVWQDEIKELHTNFSPDFLGLSEANGLWDQGFEGEDIIVGVIDTGTWPENPSLSDQADFSDPEGKGNAGSTVYGPPPAGWNGTCQSGEQWSQNDCTNKLIGARYFSHGFAVNPNARNGLRPEGFNSARDDDDVSHGTHTSTTAAGNRDVPAVITGQPPFGNDKVSGMANRARVAVYKACWNNDGCATSDLTASIDAAVADGVDVINYSIGSSSPGLLGADDIAFLFAADAGVFVATSNGNDGPAPNTIGSPAGVPWITSVGAATRDGILTTLALRVNSPAGIAGDYPAIEGAITKSLKATGTFSGNLKQADPLDGCGASLNNDLTGQIAYMARGVCTFVEKIENAVDAGAIAVVMRTDDRPKTGMGGDATAKTQTIPGVMIDLDIGLDIEAALGAGDVNVTMGPDVFLPENDVGNIMASFSSRGPNASALDIIKPDVVAPGVNILAGQGEVQLDSFGGELFGYVSGTSMASPHVAGVGALLKQMHPDWTPAMIRSALVTTARQNVLKEDGSTDADPFDMGGGYIVPNSAADPGLVYDAGFLDYLGFLCDAAPSAVAPATCNALPGLGIPTEAVSLNYPSFAVSAMVGEVTVQRTVTNVGAAGTYQVSVDAPPGIDVDVSPTSLPLAEGESATYEVTFSNVGADNREWTFGSLTWSDGTHDVRSPIAIFPVGVDAPFEVSGTGTDGSVSFDAIMGFSGDYNPGAHGMAAPLTDEQTVLDDPANSYSFVLGGGAAGVTTTLWGYGPGTAFSRWSTFDALTDGNDDLDLYIWACDAVTFACSLVDASTTATATETVDVQFPGAFAGFGVPGTFYQIDVHGWQTDGPDSNYTLFEWELSADPAADDGSLTISPAGPIPVSLQDTVGLTAEWTGLDPGVKYLGVVSHGTPSGIDSLTVVSVSTE